MPQKAPPAPRRGYIVQLAGVEGQEDYPSFRAARSRVARNFDKVFWSPFQELADGQIVTEAYTNLEDFWYHRDAVAVIVVREGRAND